MKTGEELIAEERARQVAEEGWTPEHDDAHVGGELAAAAACYAMPGNLFTLESYPRAARLAFVDPWPWEAFDKRPRDEHSRLRHPTHEERIRCLVKAGALIAAEIDRLQRLGGEQ